MASPNNEEELNSIRDLMNNKPENDFEGLSRNEMHDLIYSSISENSPVQIANTISDQVLDHLPFFRLSEEFLRLIEREGSVKLTPLGSLPKKVIVELYSRRFILEDGVESGIHKLSKEMDSLAIYTLHDNTRLAGLIRKLNGKLILTKDGTKLMKPENRHQLFIRLLRTFTNKLPWGTLDGYPKVPVGNLGWGFSVILLLKYGNEPRSKKFYGEKYLRAFPDFLNYFPQRQFGTPAEDLINCYCLRTFDRFMEWWGFTTPRVKKQFLQRNQEEIRVTDQLSQIFKAEI